MKVICYQSSLGHAKWTILWPANRGTAKQPSCEKRMDDMDYRRKEKWQRLSTCWQMSKIFNKLPKSCFKTYFISLLFCRNANAYWGPWCGTVWEPLDLSTVDHWKMTLSGSCYITILKKHEQIGPCGVIAYLLPRLPLVCERLRWATKETERETQIGEKMSASNDAAGVKCWRLPNVCVCVWVWKRRCARHAHVQDFPSRPRSVRAYLRVRVCACTPPPLPPPCHRRFVASALMWPVAKSAWRPPTSPHLNLPSPLFIPPNKWAIRSVCRCPLFTHTFTLWILLRLLLYDRCSPQLAGRREARKKRGPRLVSWALNCTTVEQFRGHWLISSLNT